MDKIISGIQQMGIGVPNVQESWAWYRLFFGVDIRVFEDAAEAPLMTKYTGGEVHKRTATLALSMDGGGGFEIWQFTSRPTNKAEFTIQLGDFGLYMCKIKSKNIEASFQHFKENGADLISNIETQPNGGKHFLVKDPNGNIFEIVEGIDWFGNTKHASNCGGVAGATIGVSNINQSLALYKDVLGYDLVVYDKIDSFPCFGTLEGGNGKIRRVLLRHSKPRKGPFAQLLGSTEIELIEHLERTDRRKIFENRYWGDWGFIHLCFDIQGMNQLQKDCESAGFPFTVDSGNTFDMGEAGGRFSYIEDPDGTLIEFVETHKVPILKKLNWYVHLKKRNPAKHLPKWMLKAMAMNRFKG
ncbi:MAG: VOC family protein [Bacteroidetes bacterium]|nr:VOC family protein [Bacteroidota bacterium]